jgi:hypothetical protein
VGRPILHYDDSGYGIPNENARQAPVRLRFDEFALVRDFQRRFIHRGKAADLVKHTLCRLGLVKTLLGPKERKGIGTGSKASRGD